MPVGVDHYHVEAVFEKDGTIRLFTLGQDQTCVMPVPTQRLVAYAKLGHSVESTRLDLEAQSQESDPPGETSQFVGRLPLEMVGRQLVVVVPNITMGKGRYRFSFLAEAGDEPEMPQKIVDEAERVLYLTPGGKYTEADIRINGSMTASQKYRGFHSKHDLHPKSRDFICPVTQTKADPNCSWTINGQRYLFCCPPCIDEFLKRAKEHPDEIEAAKSYVK